MMEHPATAVPVVNEWLMTIFMLCSAAGTVYHLKRGGTE
jgi:hypothetical protein